MQALKVLAFVAEIGCAAPAMAQSEARGALLSVYAEGVSEAAPDMATITVGVLTSGRTAGAAQADNSQQMQRLSDSLRALGVADRDIQTASLTVSPQLTRRDNRRAITGYQAANSVRVRIRDLAASGRILDAVVAAGGDIANGMTLSFQNPAAQRDAARRNAIAEARHRAELYAEGLSMRVYRVIAISEPGANASEQLMLTATLTTDQLLQDLPQIAPSGSQTPPPPPIAPGEIETRANVSVTFELR